jgi:hypothetical protein
MRRGYDNWPDTVLSILNYRHISYIALLIQKIICMKNLKIVYFSILIFASGLFAQNTRFIQVSVSDTVSLKPVSFIYQISEEEKYNYTGVGDTQNSVTTTISEVNEILERESFNDRISRNKYTFSGSIKPGVSIFITVGTEAELEKLYKIVIQLKGIEGKLVKVNYESPEKFHSRMYENMYNKAIHEASEIASQSGNSIGRLLDVSEVNSMWSGYEDFAEEYKGLGLDWLNPGIDFSKQYIRRLQFRFEMAGNN